MEANTQNTSIFNFELNDTSKLHLQGLSQWAKITALVSFISVGLSLLSTLILLGKYGSGMGTSIGSGFISWIITVLLNVILFGASKNIYSAVINTNQSSLNKGFGELARYLRILGVLCIIIGAILLIIFLFALIMGASRGFR
jgi:hypothetical protein